MTNNLIINLYSIALLTVFHIYCIKHNEKGTMQQKIFNVILEITMLMLFVDIFSRFDGNTNTIYRFINHFGNILIFTLGPILPSLWLLYTHIEVFQEEKKTKRFIYPLFVVNILNFVMVVFTQFYGYYYYIDSSNIYHRGPLFIIPALITVVLILVSFIVVIVNGKNMQRKHYLALAFFPFPPLICIILQIIFYGVSLILNSVVLSILIVFLNIQNNNIYTDYLTGLYNRKRLEFYLSKKISTSTENKTFSAIMIDLDNFKYINDNFGHDMGDDALKIFAKLLNKCLPSGTFISRYGGDEFCIVLDTSDKKDLKAIASIIENCIEKFNVYSEQSYKIGFSMGYDVYDYDANMNVDEFKTHIDTLMYENKRINKQMQAL